MTNVIAFPAREEIWKPTTPAEIREWNVGILIARLSKLHGCPLDTAAVAELRAHATELLRELDGEGSERAIGLWHSFEISS